MTNVLLPACRPHSDLVYALCVMDLLQMLFIMVGQYYYVYIQCHINYAGKERRTRSCVDQTVDHLFGAAMACSQIDDTTWVDHGRPSILDVLLPAGRIQIEYALCCQGKTVTRQ